MLVFNDKLFLDHAHDNDRRTQEYPSYNESSEARDCDLGSLEVSDRHDQLEPASEYIIEEGCMEDTCLEQEGILETLVGKDTAEDGTDKSHLPSTLTSLVKDKTSCEH